jgi:glucose-6-phosphate 1-dehydrogenase
MAEDFDVRGRGRFYEEVGALRDVVQNHLLQVIALLAMEAPTRRDVESARDQKAMVFKCMRPLDARNVVRGQYRGYQAEPGVARGSNVETFVALRRSYGWPPCPMAVPQEVFSATAARYRGEPGQKASRFSQ